jgi:putative intracellular protease/amidase
MRSPVGVKMMILFCLSVAAGAAAGRAADSGAPREDARRYVCPPCGNPCDGKVYDHPGACPLCGMGLVDKDEAEAALAARKKVAILIFTGVQIIDYTGPYEIFQAAGFDVYTVAATKDPITTVAGMTVVPKYTLDDAPPPDVLVVPGGSINGVHQSEPTLKWIEEASARADHTMSVCNGAFILAQVGLLDGLTATTTFRNVAKLRAGYPKIKVVDDQRWTDNGKIITTGGLSAGIDGALHVVESMLGEGRAQSIALGEEYDWGHPFVRGTLADRLVTPYFDKVASATGRWEVLSTRGDTRRWQLVARGTSDESATEILARLGQTLETEGRWTSVKAASAGGADSTSTRRSFRFSGPDGGPWSGSVSIDPVMGQSHQYTVTVSIAAAG